MQVDFFTLTFFYSMYKRLKVILGKAHLHTSDRPGVLRSSGVTVMNNNYILFQLTFPFFNPPFVLVLFICTVALFLEEKKICM